MDVQKVIMEGQFVRLEPLAQEHLPGLADALRDGELWSDPYGFSPRVEGLPRLLEQANLGFEAGVELVFAMVEVASGKVAGSTRFRDINAGHRRLEIGPEFVAKSRQGTPVDTESKYLMLCYAFEAWACNRVEYKTDELDAASRQRIEAIGFRQEGVLRSHYVMRNGRIRDSVVYSVVKDDWQATWDALEQTLTRST